MAKPGILKRTFDIFTKRDELAAFRNQDSGWGSFGGGRLPYTNGSYGTNKSNIVVPIYNRIAIDVSSIELRHVRLDEDGRYSEDIRSMLSECFELAANIDQGSRHFFQSVVMDLCEYGAIAIVPTETTTDPFLGSSSYDIKSLRHGRIVDWYPQHVQVNLYNDRTGNYEDIVLPKSYAAIVTNPFHAVMNDQNSILQRLLSKLRLLDSIDEKTSSGRIDLIIQFPHSLKSDARREEAKRRREEMMDQLSNTSHGVVWVDANETVTPLNRPVDNTLVSQIESLYAQLYAQLGLTESIINGTADEAAMINYHNRTVEPFLAAIQQSMKRTFLTKTARSQGQSIIYFRDPFKLIPMSQIAEISDKLTRNEIATSNDIRTQAFGWKPSKDPKAEMLINSNLNQSKQVDFMEATPTDDNDDDNVVDGELMDTPPTVRRQKKLTR